MWSFTPLDLEQLDYLERLVREGGWRPAGHANKPGGGCGVLVAALEKPDYDPNEPYRHHMPYMAIQVDEVGRAMQPIPVDDGEEILFRTSVEVELHAERRVYRVGQLHDRYWLPMWDVMYPVFSFAGAPEPPSRSLRSLTDDTAGET